MRCCVKGLAAVMLGVALIAGAGDALGQQGGLGSVITQPPAAQPPSADTPVTQQPGTRLPQGYFRMQSMFQEPSNRCLESNRVAPGAALGGASFMDACQDVSGQLWKATPAGDGYFHLTSMYLEPENMCLEGSKPHAPNDPLNGAARMDPCGNFTGQLWRFTPQDNGYFKITNLGLAGEKRCLESSAPDTPNDPLRGAARMDVCGNYSGQFWRLAPAD